MIVTFYSYKGGVGRTQLCANIANYLCHEQNKKVLLWDWDFEAPGIHYFFKKKEASSAAKGTLELFEDYVSTLRKIKVAHQSEENYKITGDQFRYPVKSDMISMLDKENRPKKGCIDLMTAGNYADDFSYRAGNFDWMEFYQYMDGAAYVEMMKEAIKNLGYDYILIDSRTGISDYSGICNIQLPDVSVMVIAATRQNFDGCETIIQKIRASQYLSLNKKKSRILPVLSRVDINSPVYSEWVAEFIRYFSSSIADLDSQLDQELVDNIFRDIYFRDTTIPYNGAIAIGENLFTDGRNESTTEYKTPFINIAKLIEDLNPDRLVQDSLGNIVAHQGEINFYGKVSEESWKAYAVKAEENWKFIEGRGEERRKQTKSVTEEIRKNKRIAAIAFNQIALKEPDQLKKWAYFQKAVENDDGYEVARQNLAMYHESYSPPKKNMSARNYDSAPSSFQIGKKEKRLLYNVAIIIILATLTGVVTSYFFYNKNLSSPVVEQTKSGNLTDSAAYRGPLLSASPYFDSLRNQRKAIGIDISNKETIFDQSKLMQYGLSFMLIKATQGKAFVDSGFTTNWAILRNKKFIAGAYHYYSLNTDPLLQADNFIKHVVISDGDLPPILDLYGLEDVTIDTAIVNDLNKYLDRVNLYYGMKPIVYVSDKLAKHLFTMGANRYYLWLNRPNRNDHTVSAPIAWSRWTFWQFSTREKFNGILSTARDPADQTVDANQFNGSVDELKAMTLSRNSGTRSLRSLYSFYTGRNKLYLRLANGNIALNSDTISGADFSKNNFYWSVELINQCFSALRTKNLSGKSHAELLAYLQNNKMISKASKSDIKLGDIVFFDFEEKKGIQASGIVFNTDNNYVYCIEGSDAKGAPKISRFRRHRGDVFLAVTLKK